MIGFTRRQTVEAILDRRPMAPRAGGRAFAPANIALCKYWGKRDEELNLPRNGSLSVSLGDLGSEAELSAIDAPADAVELGGRPLPPAAPFAARVSGYLDLFRPSPSFRFRLRTRNTVPTAAGFASSASGFAALALALDDLFGWRLPPERLSVLARLGSGSACRSVFPGFVEWVAGEREDGLDSAARPLPETWPSLRVGLWTVSEDEKPVGSRAGMKATVETSPLYPAWPGTAARDLEAIRAAIRARDVEALGRAAEGNALAMHATMIAARPALCYWRPESVRAMDAVRAARADGVPVYFTMDAGPNLKLLFEGAAEADVTGRFPGLRVVRPFA